MFPRGNTPETGARHLSRIMWKTLFELPGIVADYTIGTVVVIARLAVAEREASLPALPEASRAPTRSRRGAG